MVPVREIRRYRIVRARIVIQHLAIHPAPNPETTTGIAAIQPFRVPIAAADHSILPVRHSRSEHWKFHTFHYWENDINVIFWNCQKIVHICARISNFSLLYTSKAVRDLEKRLLY
ncbi:unnamed protein product [Gongylonema pulchrum]|uniref:Uncharacterized protein n=1 Tax=Gongylonema pulchrum TaxID=637853 RepID=A0A183EF85_9BILA|nr:unnamed protein product [Gongylonema pulchrum]